MNIRLERPADYAAVERLTFAAFPLAILAATTLTGICIGAILVGLPGGRYPEGGTGGCQSLA